MADSPPSNPSWSPAPPSPPGWSPVVATAPATPPANAPWTPQANAPAYVPFWKHSGALETVSRWLKIGGLAFVVIGILLVVAGASYPGSCATTSANCGPTGSNWSQAALNYLLAGQFLVVLGFAGIAVGGFFKMRSEGFPAGASREQLDFILADRRWNGLLIILSLILMFVLLLVVILFAHDYILLGAATT